MAARFWVGGGSSANWNATAPTNWAATSGGAGDQSVPGASDDVIFDGAGTGNSPSTISATITVLSFTVTSGYTNTITHNAVLTVAGNVTLNTSYTIAGTSALTISATSTITSGGKTWPNGVTFSGTSTTKTLVGNLVISGALTISSTSQTINWTTNEMLSCNGLTMTQGLLSGTAKIILTGGTWSGAGAVLNDLDIAGNVTVSGSVAFNTKTLTYVSGTVTTTGSTLTIAASPTIDTDGITWNNVTTVGSITITLNSLLTIGGILTQSTTNASLTFSGSSGFTIGTVTVPNAFAITWTFVNGVTYTITNAFNAFTSRIGATVLFTSDHASNRAILTLQVGATNNVLGNFTRIDASAGRTIYTFNGVVTDSLNVVSFGDPSLIGATQSSFTFGS